MRTILCDLLGIRYPIIQGGMAWVSTGELAAAVSEAGGLGIIGAGNAPPDYVRNEIRKAKALTGAPFGVNVYFMSPFTEEVLKVVLEEGVKVITTGAGNPGRYIAELKEKGVKVLPVVSSVALAQRLERVGVDAIVAEGMESGGHIGEVTTMALVPQVVDAVSIPVVAAGGIADGRGLAAALALGAVGVQVGTRFICSQECTVHENYKQAIIKAGDRSTVVTGLPGHEVRVIANRLSREFKKLAEKGASWEEFERLGTGKLRAAAKEGDVENGSVMAGQAAGLVKEVLPAKDIIASFIREAREVVQKLAGEGAVKWEE